MKTNNYQLKILPEKISFKYEGKMQTFKDKQKVKECTGSRSPRELLMGVFQTERNMEHMEI